MPWNAGDVEKHRSGLSRKQKKKWAAIANGALASCLDSGGTDCEGRAIRIANSKFTEFNPAITGQQGDRIIKKLKSILLNQDQEEIKEKVPPKEEPKFESCECEMEIFRAGTHNDDEFSEEDLEEIASNFHKLKDELRPKLKITHHGEDEEQISLAGLASYGDIVDVYLKEREDGERALFAKVSNIPKQVGDWIAERRFPERSIEVYPVFKLGTKKDSPEYHNVLKAIALLGSEMPAVPGMEPIRLSEEIESQKSICFSEKLCLCDEAALAFVASIASEIEAKLKLF